MKNINIKKLLKKYYRRPVFEAPMFRLNLVERDWKIMVLVFAFGLISLSIFAWQIYLSDKIGGGYLSSTITSTETNTKTLDKVRLQADILIFENRADEYLRLKNSSKVVDPSL